MRLIRATVMALMVVAVIFCFGNLAISRDSSGAETGNRTDVQVPEGQSASATTGAVLDEVGHSKIAINYVWLFLGGILVFFMQAGFALLECGLCQKKNATQVIMTNFMIFGIATVAFYLVGFAIMFGGVGALKTLGGAPILTREITVGGWGIMGAKGFALSGPAYDVSIFMFFLFQVVFMDTAATIPTGAMAERWKFSAFAVYGVFMGAVLYPVFGNWVWGGGWLSQLGAKAGLGNGFVDFAGSSVVHAVGGLTGLMGILVLGPRFGKFDRDGKPRAIPGHNIPLAIIGTIILVFGWFGFNAGSTLSG
ncbi:MAG: ammonium transporter, partial [Actinobacteria bacterium]|nr:ammonium transporter [Actinomycetota bacterium]